MPVRINIVRSRSHLPVKLTLLLCHDARRRQLVQAAARRSPWRLIALGRAPFGFASQTTPTTNGCYGVGGGGVVDVGVGKATTGYVGVEPALTRPRDGEGGTHRQGYAQLRP